MQDPGGDGKIVYLFLPVYKVNNDWFRSLLSNVDTAEVWRPKDGSCGSGISKYQIQWHTD